jgi:hypothetical protein
VKYLPTAFGQLAFAWKLYNYGLDGKIDPAELDAEVTFQDEDMLFVVPKALGDSNDLLIALENNLTIAFGAAAITLNRVREEIGIPLPDPIDTEQDQCVALIYQIRNAFAHDIAEPIWRINGRYRRAYEFGRMKFDLTDLDGEVFRYEQLGGPDKFFAVKDYFCAQFGEL